jgi:hypothetical protein
MKGLLQEELKTIQVRIGSVPAESRRFPVKRRVVSSYWCRPFLGTCRYLGAHTPPGNSGEPTREIFLPRGWLYEMWHPGLYNSEVKIKSIPVQAVEAFKVVRCWGSHIVWTVDSQMAVRLSALRTDCALLPIHIIFLLLVLISVKRLSEPQGLVRPD